MMRRCFAFVVTLLALTQPVRAVQKLAPKLLGAKWKSHRSYPLPVFEAAGGVLRTSPANHTLIIAGGYLSNSGLRATTEVHALSLQSPRSQWTSLARMPRALTHCAQALVNDTLYLCGGFLGAAPGRSISDCVSYSLSTNAWSSLPSLPIAVGGGAMVYIAPLHALFYAGGMHRKQGSWGGTDMAHSFLLSLDEVHNGWVRKADMPNPRNHMAAAVAASRYLFLGGQHSADEEEGNQATLNEYVYWQDRWLTRAPLPQPLGHVVASSLPFWNGVLVLGGVLNGRRQSSAMYYYDARADGWSSVGALPRAVQSPVCGVSHRRVFCSSGLGAPGGARQSHYRALTLPLPV